MLVAEYVRNYNCNYERITLEQKPEEKRYQYCILSRGGIRYLLPCSLRYIDSNAYLYYDISSTQNLKQVFGGKKIDREWIKDFLWGMKQMRFELNRFLLEEDNIIWSPEHIYQDLEKNDFFFLYMPYYEGETGLNTLMDFLVENADYEDDGLVEFLYLIHEKILQIGGEYLHKQIHEDFSKIENREKQEVKRETERREEELSSIPKEGLSVEEQNMLWSKEEPRRGLRFFREGKKRKQTQKEEYREVIRERLNDRRLLAVCEESHYNEEPSKDFAEEFGKTIFVEEATVTKVVALYKPDGEKVAALEKFPFVIGKKRENVDLVINDYSASRVHARITCEEGVYFIEDLNSTNGTFKNGLRLKPYEKRKLENGDELRFGKTEYVYR